MTESAPGKRVIVAEVRNKPGVLTGVTSLYCRRGFNLDSVTVGSCEMPDFSRMTIVVGTDKGGTPQQLEQGRKQLEGLVDVEEAHDVSNTDKKINHAGCEMALIEAGIKSKRGRERILSTLQNDSGIVFMVVQETPKSMFVGVMGGPDGVKGVIERLRDSKIKIKKIAPSGLVALKIDKAIDRK